MPLTGGPHICSTPVSLTLYDVPYIKRCNTGNKAFMINIHNPLDRSHSLFSEHCIYTTIGGSLWDSNSSSLRRDWWLR